MTKRATAEDVAKAAGVSKWTVIRAFTPGASIAEASRSRVLAAAEGMNYRPNLLARSLATNLTHQIAVFVDDFANPYKLELLERVTAELQAHGLLVVLININDRVDHVHALLNADQRQFDAIVLLGTAFRDETLADARLRADGPPLYVLARDSQIDTVTSVSCDSASAMQAIRDHLVEIGRRRPLFLSGPSILSTALGRRSAFEEAWREVDDTPVRILFAERYSHGDGSKALATCLDAMDLSARWDAIVCENDVLAYGVMDVLRFKTGLHIPEDIAVVGFDDGELSSLPTYNLTSVRQPVDDMVQALADMLVGKRKRESVQYPGRLVRRGSTLSRRSGMPPFGGAAQN